MARVRSKQLKFYVNDTEFEQIKSKVDSSWLSQDEYLRRAALEKDIVVIEGLKDFALELKRIGVNVNQLTKLAHQNRLTDSNGKLREINEELNQVWQSLRQLIRDHQR